MEPWVESFGVLLLAAAGVLVGAWASRLPKPWWTFGYLIPLASIALYAASSRLPWLTLVPPVSWMTTGRIRFAIFGILGAILLTTPLLKLPRRRDRIAVSILMVCVVSVTSIWPFLAPAFNRNLLSHLTTRMGSNGVCLQSTEYTCGPASAVTALRKLGFPADEGEIAILAHTSTAIGTPPDILADALQKHYGKDGLICEYRAFTNVDELRTNIPTLVIVNFNFIMDHYLTILDVSDTEVTVGDPLLGWNKISRAEFENKWRFVGVVLKKKFESR